LASPATGEEGFSPEGSKGDPLETRERVSDKRYVVLLFTTCFVLTTFDARRFGTTGKGGVILSLEGRVGEARVEEVTTVEGFDSEEAVLDAGKHLAAFVVPFVRLIFAFPIDCFLTSRHFGKGVKTVRPELEDLMPRLREGREMGKTISGTYLTEVGFRADVGS